MAGRLVVYAHYHTAIPLVVYSFMCMVFPLDQVDYVETLMKFEAFESLRRNQAADIVAVDSALASLFLTKAYSDREKLKVGDKLTRIEVKRQIEARWDQTSDDYKAALNNLRASKVVR